jgi:hypothetical protein
MNKHGELLLLWEGSNLIIEAKGPFNEEGALAGIVAMKKSVAIKNLATWQRLGVWDEEALGSPSTLKMAKDTHKWCFENGCERAASIVTSSIQQSVAEKIFGSESKIFRLESDARKWLTLKPNS